MQTVHDGTASENKFPTIAVVHVKRPYLNPSETRLFTTLGQMENEGVRFVDITPLFLNTGGQFVVAMLEKVRGTRCALVSNYVPGCLIAEPGSDFFSRIDGTVETLAHVHRFIQELYRLDIPKITSCMLYDIHDPGLMDFVRDYCQDGLLLNSRFGEIKGSDTYTVEEVKFKKNENAVLQAKCIIESLHCVGTDEFLSVNNIRPWHVAIPGVSYKRRQIAWDSLEARYKRFKPPFKPVNAALRLAAYIRETFTWGKPEFAVFNFANWYHRTILGLTEIIYTDGGMTDYAVRKFFEIPAAGSLLLCTPFNGMGDLGFQSGITHIECTPEEVGSLVRTLDFSSPSVRKIALEGQQLVMQKHSSKARACQILAALRLVADGKLKSAYWRDGEYVYS